MRTSRIREGTRDFFISHAALPEKSTAAAAPRPKVEVAQIHETAMNIVTEEDEGFAVLAQIEIENYGVARLRLDDVWVEMAWGERLRLLSVPVRQQGNRNFYLFGGLRFDRDLVINHRICKGQYLVGHRSRVEGLLFGVIESCPPASVQRILPANLTLVFTNGSASHTRLLLANSTIYKRSEVASATRGVVAPAPTDLRNGENHDA